MRQPTRFGLGIVPLVAGILITGCSMSVDQERAVREWLECIDCGEEALSVVDSLADWNMESALILAMQGPPDSVQSRVIRHLRAAYRMAMGEMGLSPVPADEDQYVQRRLGGFVAQYQWRAVAALGRMGTPRARRALRWALLWDSSYPAHVTTEIRTQLADSIVAVTTTLDTVLVTEPVDTLPIARVYSGGTPWAGAAVTFEIHGGGIVYGAYAITDDSGFASVDQWYAGSAPGNNVLLAQVPRDTVSFLVVGIN